jgi:RNA methyltransferase, TrmH family
MKPTDRWAFLRMLTSLQNPRVKLARQLQQRREARERELLFVAEGTRLTDDFLRAGMLARFAFVSASPAAQQWMRDHAQVECLVVNDAVMREISLETTPPGVVVVFQMPATPPASIDDSGLILILDGLRDPGNLGACLRVAAGADCRRVLLAPGSVDPFNPKVVRGGMGAHARLTVASLDWDAIRAACQGRAVWAADAGGARRYDQVAWAEPNALIIGGEASGISPEAHSLASGVVSIPLANNVESLNAAVACGVILFEAARQRQVN